MRAKLPKRDATNPMRSPYLWSDQEPRSTASTDPIEVSSWIAPLVWLTIAQRLVHRTTYAIILLMPKKMKIYHKHKTQVLWFSFGRKVFLVRFR